MVGTSDLGSWNCHWFKIFEPNFELFEVTFSDKFKMFSSIPYYSMVATSSISTLSPVINAQKPKSLSLWPCGFHGGFWGHGREGNSKFLQDRLMIISQVFSWWSFKIMNQYWNIDSYCVYIYIYMIIYAGFPFVHGQSQFWLVPSGNRLHNNGKTPCF